MNTISARLLTAAAFALFGASAQSGAADLLRAPWRAYEAGTFPSIAPSSMTLGDIDEDGDLDALLGLYFFGAPGIAVLKAEPDASYGGLQIYGTGSQRSVGDVALADIDGDADLDALATIPDANFQTRLVAVWRNDGGGSLGSRRTFVTGVGPTGLVAADFTGDGFADVVTADFGFPGIGDTVSLLAHNGQTGAAAGFLAPRSFFSGQYPDVVRAGDFDGDGDLDLAVGRETWFDGPDHGSAVLLNEDGAGTFGPPTFYDMGLQNSARTSALAVADVDRDGRLDLVGSGSTSLGVRRGVGNGTFESIQVLPLTTFSFTANALTTGDLNGDTWPDIVAATPTGRSLDGFHVFLSNGSGGFQPDAFYEASKQTYDVALVDADGDSDLDVVTAANDSSILTVHRNNGSGVFFVPQRFPAGVLASGMDSADIDGDDDLDIATADTAVNVLRNRGDGTFEPFFVVRTPGVNPNEVKLRDMNGDGAPDILVSDDLNSDFAVALNRGDGTFEQSVQTPMGGSQGGSVDAFDLDNDGILDVAVSDEGPVPALRLAQGIGSGTAFIVRAPLEFGAIPFGLGGGDFNHDGNVDLVTGSAFGFTLFPGNGDFTFDTMLATGVSTLTFTVTDVDADGELDIFYDAGQRTSFQEWVGVLRGYGDGTFRFPEEYPGPVGLESAFQITSDVDAADMNGDGLPDFVLTANAPNDISIYLANPDGSLQPPQRYGAGYSARHSVIGDFDGDQRVDVATAISAPPSGFDDVVVLLPGTAAPSAPFDLDIAGACPGPLTITATGASPGARVRFLRATGTGNAVWPGGPCAGTPLGLDESARLLRTVTADADGVASFTIPAPPQACGVLLLQALDASTCATTHVNAL